MFRGDGGGGVGQWRSISDRSKVEQGRERYDGMSILKGCWTTCVCITLYRKHAISPIFIHVYIYIILGLCIIYIILGLYIYIIIYRYTVSALRQDVAYLNWQYNRLCPPLTCFIVPVCFGFPLLRVQIRFFPFLSEFITRRRSAYKGPGLGVGRENQVLNGRLVVWIRQQSRCPAE